MNAEGNNLYEENNHNNYLNSKIGNENNIYFNVQNDESEISSSNITNCTINKGNDQSLNDRKEFTEPIKLLNEELNNLMIKDDEKISFNKNINSVDAIKENSKEKKNDHNNHLKSKIVNENAININEQFDNYQNSDSYENISLNKIKPHENFSINKENVQSLNIRKEINSEPIKLLNEELNNLMIKDDEKISFIKNFDSVNVIIEYKDKEEKYECLIFPPNDYNEVDDLINEIKENVNDIKLINKDDIFHFQYKSINKILRTKDKIDYKKYVQIKKENEKLKKKAKEDNEKINNLINYINMEQEDKKKENKNKKLETQMISQNLNSMIKMKESKNIDKKINYLTQFPSGKIIIAANDKIIIYSIDFNEIIETLNNENQKLFYYISVKDDNNILTYSKGKDNKEYIITWKRNIKKSNNFLFIKNKNKNLVQDDVKKMEKKLDDKENKFISDEIIINDKNDNIIFISYLSNGDFISCSKNKNYDEALDKIKIWKSNKEENHPGIESLIVLENNKKIFSVGGNQIILWDLSLKFLKRMSIENNGEFIKILNENKFIVNERNIKLNIYDIDSFQLNFSITLNMNKDPLTDMIILREIKAILIINNDSKKIKVYTYDDNSKQCKENEIEIKNKGNFKLYKLKNNEFLLYDKNKNYIEIWNY